MEPLSGYLILASKLYAEGKKFQGGWNFGPLDQNNYSVKSLIEKIIEETGKGSYLSTEMSKKEHEASLLKLDISKAMNLLEWSPLLNFNETVNMTVKGYLDEMESKDVYSARVKQIRNYLEIGGKKNIYWVKKN